MNTPIPSIVPVPFHGATLSVIDNAGDPYVPMRPVVEGMGLAWASQFVKLNANKERWGVSIIETPSSGGEQRAVCLPLRKLPGWLMSIHPNKVRPELRERIVQYQTECDDVLWQHWSQHRSRVEPATTSTATDRAVLTNAVRKMIAVFGKRGRALNFDDAWALVHVHMGVSSIHELPAERVPDAVAYVERLLEGELLGREPASVPTSRLDINFPVQRWIDETPMLAGLATNTMLSVPPRLLFGEGAASSPTSALLTQLTAAGYNVDACRIEVMAMRHHLLRFDATLDGIQFIANVRRDEKFMIGR